MHDHTGLDDELAAFTDQLLAGEDVQAPPELEELAGVVRQLHAMIAPESRPDPAFRERLTQRVHREWSIQHKRQPRAWHSRRLVQLTALAAVVALTLLALLLLSDGDEEPVQGTALGSVTGVIVVAAVLVGLGVLIVWYRQRRN
jgi:hypothetical protein